MYRREHQSSRPKQTTTGRQVDHCREGSQERRGWYIRTFRGWGWSKESTTYRSHRPVVILVVVDNIGTTESDMGNQYHSATTLDFTGLEIARLQCLLFTLKPLSTVAYSIYVACITLTFNWTYPSTSLRQKMIFILVCILRFGFWDLDPTIDNECQTVPFLPKENFHGILIIEGRSLFQSVKYRISGPSLSGSRDQ